MAEVNAPAAAAYALEHYDSNHDGVLDKAELAKCPPLAAAMSGYDVDNNGLLSAEEITKRLTQQCGRGLSLTSIDCTVLLDGRPLAGATLRLRPAEMLGGSITPAVAVTDDAGVAHPKIDDDRLPIKLKGVALLYPGLYYVEITHPTKQIPARYNAATELGLEIDPTARELQSPTFQLKTK